MLNQKIFISLCLLLVSMFLWFGCGEGTLDLNGDNFDDSQIIKARVIIDGKERGTYDPKAIPPIDLREGGHLVSVEFLDAEGNVVKVHGPKVIEIEAGQTKPISIGSEIVVDFDTIKIGAILPLTGGFSTFGRFTLNGMLLAIEEINQTGGALNKKLTLVTEDTQSNRDVAESLAKKLTTPPNRVNVIIGSVTSSESLRIATIAQQACVPQIAPPSTADSLTRVGNCIFRACFNDSFQGKVMAAFAIKNNFKKAAVLHATGEGADYAEGLTKSFMDAFKQKGGTVVTEQTYDLTDTDFRSQLRTIKSTGAQTVFLPGYEEDSVAILKQAQEINLTIPFLGADGWGVPKVIKAAKNAFYSDHFSAEDPDRSTQAFVKAYQDEYGEPPTGLAALGYDAVKICAIALGKAGSLDPEAIREKLALTSNYFGATTISHLDQKTRDPVKSAVIIQIEEGQAKFHERISPEDID